MTQQEILAKLDTVALSTAAWEEHEDIMTFNGKPIGMTVSGRLEIHRWWPALKREIAELLATE
jgi:hypothetical protein